MARQCMTGIEAPLGYRLVAALGAVFCALAVGLAAYAAHAAPEIAAARLDSAVLLLFIHGLALAIFAAHQFGRLAGISLALWIIGCIAFCGSLVAAALWGSSTTVAPAGGIAFIIGWLLRAIVLVRPSGAIHGAVQ